MTQGRDKASGGADDHVGEVIRELREQHHLSVRTLASKSGFSPSFISQVENGQASPSIASLERLAAALGVRLGDFFRAVEPITPTPVRAAARPAVQSEWSRARLECLAPIGPTSEWQAVMIALNPGGARGKRTHVSAAEQFALIFEGEAVLTLDSQEYVLQRGDAITIPAGVPHRWENKTGSPSQIVLMTAARRF